MSAQLSLHRVICCFWQTTDKPDVLRLWAKTEDGQELEVTLFTDGSVTPVQVTRAQEAKDGCLAAYYAMRNFSRDKEAA